MDSALVALRLIVPNAERRNWLENLIHNDSHMRVVGSGANFDSALAPAGDCDVCIVDLSNPRAAQPQFWAGLHVMCPAARIVALTENAENGEAIGAALHAGAYYMVAWDEDPGRIVRAVEAAASGQGFIPLARVLGAMTSFFQEPTRPRQVVLLDLLEIDVASRRVCQSGTQVHLTSVEFDLLLYLVSHAGRLVTRPELARAVWRYEVKLHDHLEHIKFTIMRLRRKIEPEPARPRYIVTIRAHGYQVPLELVRH